MSENDFNYYKRNSDNCPDTISTRILTQHQQQSVTQMSFIRPKTLDEPPINPDHPKVTKTVKVYQKKIIRKHGPNGEYSEEIIESGDQIPENGFAPVIRQSDVESSESNKKLYGQSQIQANFGFKTVSQLGDETQETFSTGPINVTFEGQLANDCLPVGATVSMTSQFDKLKTVTHSSTVDGQQKIQFQKAAYMSIYGESKQEVKSSNQMEDEIEKSLNISENLNNPKTNKWTESDSKVARPVHETTTYTEPPTNPKESQSDKNPNLKMIKLSKILKFKSSIPKVDIISKEVIKEGKVKAFEVYQIAPNMLKKISSTPKKTFHLIVFTDLVIIAYKKSSKEAVVIECCDKNKVHARTYSDMGYQKMNLGKTNVGSKSGLIHSCFPIKATASKLCVEQFFVLQFNKEIATTLTEPLVLAAINIENRDQWVKAISENQLQ